VELVTEIRSRCSKNEELRLLEESTEDNENPCHPNRLLNASSRKISLTCQTLPSPPRLVTSLTSDESARAMLEPKRSSGGRLRSPAPSPIPSPVASPIPSPSRNRFVVCRVPETSLRSTDSSASSSPVTPPSLGSSPCFFGASGPSRFRVSVVESTGASCPSPKSVVTSSSSSSITIGFNVKVQAIGDSDSTTKANTTTQAASDNMSVETFSIVPLIRETSHDEDIKNEDRYEEVIENKEIRSDKSEVKTWCEIDNIVVMMRNDDEMVCEQLTQDDVVTQSQFERESIATTQGGSHDEVKDQNNVTKGLESTTISENTEAIGDHGITVYTSTKELQVPAYPNEDAVLTRISVVEDKALNSVIKLSLDDTSELCMDEASKKLSACVPAISSTSTASRTSSAHMMESHSQEQLNTSIQKHKSNLEKLLSLFQHPGQFFSDSATTAADVKNSLQENVSNVMALGDKMQQYLKESRAKINTDNSCSSESSSRNRSVKNVTQLQNLSSIFTSFKLEPHISLVEHGAKFFGQTKSQDIDIREDSEESSDIEIARSNEKNSFHQEIPKNDEDLLDQERKQFMRNDDGNLIDQGKNQITKNGLNNLFDQWQNQLTKNDEKNLIDQEKDQINRNDEKNLFRQEKNQAARDDEQKFNQITKNDDKHSFDQMKDQITKIDEKNFENQREIEKKRVHIAGNENFQMREKNQDIADLQDQQKNKIVNNNEYNLSNQGKVFMRNSEDLENMKGERIVINDKKDSTDMQNTYVDEKGDMCSVHKLQWSKIDFNDRPLPESVQSKDDFVDNLIFDSDCVTVTNATVLSSLAREPVCVIAKLTDRAEYPVLQLSQNDGTGYNNAKRLDDCNDDNSREEYDDAQDQYIQSIEHNDAECIKCNEAEILENNDAGYLERKDTDKAANASIAMRTCDTTTTDSINQTSDSSFPICNIVHDRKTVDSISIASEIESTMPNNVDGMLSTLLNNDRASLTSTDIPGESTIMSKNVDDEVTNDAYCIADQDRQRDFRRGNKEDLAEVLDITCRDYAHRRSTSVNIKIEPCVSETTRPASESQMVLEEHRERQSFMPNAEIHRIIPKYAAADTENHISEEAVNDSKRIDPTILVTPYEIPVSLDKSDAEELIFCMTDISFTDNTSVEDDLSSCVMPKDTPNEIKIIKVTEPFFELPVSSTVPMTVLLIGNPEIVHSQDSGIEETVLAIDDAVETMDMHSAPPPPTRSNLQESVDSGIESECSSICNKMESVISERALEATAKKPRNHNGTHERNDSNVGDEDDNEDDEDNNGDDDDNNKFAKFTSDCLTKETRLIDNDSMSGIAHSYLNNIKCAVVSTAHSVAGMLTNNAPMEVVVTPDDGIVRPTAPIIAHSPTTLHGTR